MAVWARLGERAVVGADGPEVRKLLQGLVSNDLDDLAPDRPLYAALLTPQGKYLFDFLMVDRGEGLWLDAEAARIDDLVRRLLLYRLRAQAAFVRRDDLAVYALFGEGTTLPPLPETVAGFVDPRLPALGVRLVGPPELVEPMLADAFESASEAAYDAHRLALGVPNGSRDLTPDKALLLESGFVELNGVVFDKGCFVGQELTARMRYRATVRKRLLPVRLSADVEPGTPVLAGAVEVGDLHSVRNGAGLALIRLERWRQAQTDGVPLQAGAATVEPWVPDWVDLSFGAKTAASSA